MAECIGMDEPADILASVKGECNMEFDIEIPLPRQEPVGPMELVERLEPLKEYVTDKVSVADRYLALAEECAELAQACLKINRALTCGNPTPISKEEATSMVVEELTDVWLCAYTLDIYPDAETAIEKAERWCCRLAAASMESE